MWLVLSLACRPDAPTTEPAPSSPTSPTGSTGTTAETGSTPESTADTGPPPVVFDCATVPEQPTGFRVVPGARGYHDVAFDPQGHILGITEGFNPDLLAVDDQGGVSVFVPRVGVVEQMTWLPDGDLALGSLTDGTFRLSPNGGRTPIAPSVRPYGLILGPDQMLYAADQDQVLRVDPSSGDVEVVLPRGALDAGTPRVIAFDLDYTRMFIGTYGGSRGRIYQVPLDANLDPAGPVTVFASGVGTGDYHDAIGVDVCGNLYVPDYSTSALWRVSPNGEVVKYLDAQGFVRSPYGHGVEWGNGVASWRLDAIYLPQPYSRNEVMEIVIGVPSRDWDGGIVINRP